MQTESIQKYKEYNFSLNPTWIKYFSELYPTPSFNQVEKIKRKWYNKNIDANLPLEFNEDNINANPSGQSNFESNQQYPQSNSNFSSRPPEAPSSALNQSLYKIEGYLKIFFVLGLLLLSGFHLKLLICAICLMALVRNFGFPKFNKDYFIKLIPSEFFANLLYILSISLHSPQNGLLFFLPIGIHLSSGIVEFLGRTNPSLLSRNMKINEISNIIKNNRNALIIAKNKVEFCIFIYLLLIWIVGLSSLFQIIIYLQFLNLKYKFNGNMQTAIWELRNYLVGNPNIPGFLRNIVSKFFELFLKLMNIF